MHALTSPWRLFSSALLLIGALVGGFFYLNEGIPPATQRYMIATVSRADIARSVRSSGRLVPLVSVDVSTQISGLITEVNVDFSSHVKRGDVLARIDSSTYEQHLRQARADLAAAEAAHALTLANAKRLRGLYEDEIISHQEYDQIESLLQQSDATLLTRRAAVANARVDLKRCTISAPIDGIVIYKQAEVGRTVVSSLNAPTLFTIAKNLTKMRIIAAVSEVDIWDVHVGQSVVFTVDALPDHTFTGQVTQIRDPYTPPDTQKQPTQQDTIATFEAVIEVGNERLLLRPSLTATVTIVVERRRAVMQIPNSALRVKLANAPLHESQVTAGSRGGTLATVYRLSPDASQTPEPVLVQLGITDSFVTEVLDGLRERDHVITGITSSPELSVRNRYLPF